MNEDGLTVTYKLKRRSLARGPVKNVVNADPDGRSRANGTAGRRANPDRLARMLALAHLVEREIESGTIRDYGEAARLLGMSRTRMTQVGNLLALSPSIQEAILTERVVVAERNLRDALRHAGWADQDRLVRPAL